MNMTSSTAHSNPTTVPPMIAAIVKVINLSSGNLTCQIFCITIPKFSTNLLVDRVERTRLDCHYIPDRSPPSFSLHHSSLRCCCCPPRFQCPLQFRQTRRISNAGLDRGEGGNDDDTRMRTTTVAPASFREATSANVAETRPHDDVEVRTVRFCVGNAGGP